MRTQRKGFSVILAIVVTAFLTIVSAGVLDLVLRELKTSGAYWRGVSTQAGAEGALEWALLKAKNHGAGFEDKVAAGVDKESLLLSGRGEFADLKPLDQVMEYDMVARSGSYQGVVAAHDFEVLPLYYDSGTTWAETEGNAHAFDFNDGDIVDLRSVKLSGLTLATGPNAGSGAELVWNIVGTRTKDDDGKAVTSGDTDGIADTKAFDSATTDTAYNKKVIPDDQVTNGIEKGPVRTSVDEKSSIATFMSRHDAKYLVLYNFNDEDVAYAVTAGGPFSLPETKIYGSATVGDFKQTLEFADSRRSLFSGLKYSLFSAQ